MTAARMLEAHDQVTEFPGEPILRESSQDREVFVFRHGRREGTGRLRVIDRTSHPKKYWEADFDWAALRDVADSLLDLLFAEASRAMAKL